MQAVFKGIGGVLRGVGAAIDAAGVAVQGKLATSDALMPSLTRLPYQGVAPAVAETAFIAPNAAVMGDVEIGANSSVWYGAVLRGDVQKIKVGHTTNIQDRVVVHVAKHNPNNVELPTIIGNKVTIGHGAIIHACTIEDEALIGMGAKVLDGAVVKKNAIVAAGAVVGPGTVVPSGEVWAGIPAKKLRSVDPEEADFISTSAENYAKLGKQHFNENAKVWLTVLHDDTLRYDIQTRDPNSDEAAGLVRDPETRQILAGPYDTQKQV